MDIITEIFEDKKIRNKIQEKLPYLFQLAELESMRGGKIGMEVGTIRERILVSLLIYKFSEKKVITDISITKPEVDVLVSGIPYSIKTITQNKLGGGVKLIWTVDAEKSKEFRNNYYPEFGMILVHINWANGGGLYYFSKEIQRDIFNKLGRKNYIKLPKEGTNPRGVEMSSQALRELGNHPERLMLPINWTKSEIIFNPFKRWVDYWKEN